MKLGLISLALVAALAGGIGYVVKANTTNDNINVKKIDNTIKENTASVVENNSLITEEQAREIALKSVPNGQVTEISYDRDDFTPNYEITVYDESYEYDIKISEEDGTILESSKESRSNIANIEVKINENEAKNIALSQVAEGNVLKISLDYDDSIPTYDIKVTDGVYDYEFEINANDGTIISQEKEALNL